MPDMQESALNWRLHNVGTRQLALKLAVCKDSYVALLLKKLRLPIPSQLEDGRPSKQRHCLLNCSAGSCSLYDWREWL